MNTDFNNIIKTISDFGKLKNNLTKEQEKQLFQAFLQLIPENSYLHLTFDGLTNFVNYNIDNDFAFNAKEDIQRTITIADTAKKERQKLLDELNTAHNKYSRLYTTYNNIKENCITLTQIMAANTEKFLQYDEEITTKDNEILKLKAELYDLQQENKSLKMF